jgi:hypothetical protein
MKRTSIIALAAFVALANACNEPMDAGVVKIFETIEFESDRLVVPEEVPDAVIPVFLSGRITEDVTLTIKLEPKKDLLARPEIMAEEGTHFRLPVKTLLVEKGSTRGFFPLEIIDDIVVNENRVFDLTIETVEGIARSYISQTCRVTIRNDDFWPTVGFGTSRYQTTEHDSELVIPLVVGGGVIRSPFEVTLAVADATAAEGTNFTVDRKSFTFTEENRRDSIVIRLKEEELSADAQFDLSLAINDAGRAGRYMGSNIVIRNVVKRVGFTQSLLSTFKGYRALDVPVWFDGVRSPRDITAHFRVKSAVGVTEGTDFALLTGELTTKGDTTLAVTLEFEEQVKDAGLIEITLEVYDVEGGDIARQEVTVVTTETDRIDRSKWTIVSYSSEATNEGAAPQGRPAAILDGLANTFWHSKWSSPAAQLPHQIVIGMDKPITPESITLNRRTSNRDLKTVYFDSSPNGFTWTTLGFLDYENNTSATYNSKTLLVPLKVEMSYLRVRITESNNGQNASFSEINVNGLINR